MKVLVIGGTGFLSGAVTRQLLAAGHAVTIFTRGERPLPNFEGEAQAIRGDRKDRAAFVARFAGSDFDAVVDCICCQPEEAEAGVAAFASSGAHLVVISTDFVYGAERTLPMTEETPRRALSRYG